MKNKQLTKNVWSFAQAKTVSILAATLLCIVAVLAMVGCNEPDPPPPNTKPPTVTITNANQTKTLAPDLVIELSATVTQGTNPIQSKEWTLKNATVNGVTPVFADKTAATTTVTGIKKAGTFVFELKVKDTTGVEGTAQATVVVESMTVTANIVVPAIPFASTATLDFGLSSSYTGYNNDFPNGCITYTLKDNKNHDFSSSGQVNAGDSTLGYVNAEGITFTQTFYYNNQVVDTRIVLVRFATVGGGRFMTIDVDGSWASSGTIPTKTLTLSKTITEILPPPITKTVTVSFPAFTAGPTLSFAPTYTPEDGWGKFSQSEITYTLTDNSTPSKIWNSASGFNGQITASEHYTVAGTVIFTQTFYLNGEKLTNVGSQRTVILVVNAFPSIQFGSITSDTGSVTLTLTKPGTW